MITTLDDIEDLFNSFHDGSLVIQDRQSNPQIWKIDCEYLAEMIYPTFNFFYLKIYAIQQLSFEPWFDDTSKEKVAWTGSKLDALDLEILSAKSNGKTIEVIGLEDFVDGISGGTLSLLCEKIEVFDQQSQSITLEELKVIVELYWQKKCNAR